MKAIIVPGVTDLNKGDQALVWESYRLAKDTALFDEVFIVDAGETDHEKQLLISQSQEKGFHFIENILRHPRRGKHHNEYSKETNSEFSRMAFNGLADFIKTWFLLQIANHPKLVSIFYSKKTYTTLKTFSETNAIIVKGGGFIHSYGEITSTYLMWYFLFYLRLALKLKKKVVFLPNSFGPFKGFLVKYQIKKVLKKVDLIYAREGISAKSLSELLEKEIKIQNDLGFYLKNEENKTCEEILKKYNLLNQKIIGLTVRPWRFPGQENANHLYRNYLQSIRDLVSHALMNEDYKIVLCNQSLGPNAHEDDRNAIREVMTFFKNNKRVIWIDENLPCDTLKALYSHFYFFIGTRFHSVIFALTSAVPSIAIGYGGNKAQGIMGDFDLNEYVVQIEKINSEKLIEMFDHAIENYDAIKDSLTNPMNLLQERRNRMIAEIQSLYS